MSVYCTVHGPTETYRDTVGLDRCTFCDQAITPAAELPYLVYLEGRVKELEAAKEDLETRLETASRAVNDFGAERHRLQAVEKEYERLKGRANRLEDEIERLTRLSRGEGDWECSDCRKELTTVTEWEQHECLTTRKVEEVLESRYRLDDMTLVVEALWQQPNREEILEHLVAARRIIGQLFKEPRVWLELNYGGDTDLSWYDLNKKVTFDIVINPTEQVNVAWRLQKQTSDALRALPGYQEQHKVDFYIKYAQEV